MKKILLFALILIFCFSVHATPTENVLKYSKSFTVNYYGSLSNSSFYSLPENYSHELKISEDKTKLITKTDIGFPLNLDNENEKKIIIYFGVAEYNYSFEIDFIPNKENKKKGKIIIEKTGLSNSRKEVEYDFTEKKENEFKTENISFTVEWISFNIIAPSTDVSIKNISFEKKFISELNSILLNKAIKTKLDSIESNLNSFGNSVRVIDLSDSKEFTAKKIESIPLTYREKETNLSNLQQTHIRYVKKILGYGFWNSGIDFDGDTKENYNHLLVLNAGKPLMFIYMDKRDRWHVKTIKKEYQNENYLSGFELLKKDFDSINLWNGWEETEEIRTDSKRYADLVLSMIGISGLIESGADLIESEFYTKDIPLGPKAVITSGILAKMKFASMLEKQAYLISLLQEYRQAGTAFNVIFNGTKYSLNSQNAVNVFLFSSEAVGGTVKGTEVTMKAKQLIGGMSIKLGSLILMLSTIGSASIAHSYSVNSLESTSVFSGNTAKALLIWDYELLSTKTDAKLMELIITVPYARKDCVLIDEFIDEQEKVIPDSMKKELIENMDIEINPEEKNLMPFIYTCKIPEEKTIWICGAKEGKEINLISKAGKKEYEIIIKPEAKDIKEFTQNINECYIKGEIV
jgi:hypothetical protein